MKHFGVSFSEPEVTLEGAEEGFHLFDFLDFRIIVRWGGCRAGVDLLIVLEQPGDLPEKQSEASRITLASLLLTYFPRM